jgi:hypothetical protein
MWLCSVCSSCKARFAWNALTARITSSFELWPSSLAVCVCFWKQSLGTFHRAKKTFWASQGQDTWGSFSVCMLDMPWKHAQHFFLMSKRERCFGSQTTHCDQVRKWVLGYGQYVCTWTLRGWGCPCLFRHKLYRHVLLSQRSGMYVVCIQGLALTLDMNLNLSSTGIESYWKILVLCTVCICSNALDISRWMDSARIKCYGGVCTVCRYGSCIYTFNNWHAAHHKKNNMSLFCKHCDYTVVSTSRM